MIWLRCKACKAQEKVRNEGPVILLNGIRCTKCTSQRIQTLIGNEAPGWWKGPEARPKPEGLVQAQPKTRDRSVLLFGDDGRRTDGRYVGEA